MSNVGNPSCSPTKLQGVQPISSPPSRRNTKNLSLNLNENLQDNINPFIKTPTTATNSNFNREISNTISPSFPSIPHGVRLYRHPSLSQKDFPSFDNNNNNNNTNNHVGLKRRTTLSLSIPVETEALKYNSSSASSSKPSSSSILSSNSSNSYSPESFKVLPSLSSPYSSSSSFASFNSNQPLESYTTSSMVKAPSSSSSSNATIKGYSNGDLKTQTLIQNLSNIGISDDGDNSKLDSYPNGPKCVYDPYLFLYSEPSLKEIEEFDLVINVAKELLPPFLSTQELSESLQSNNDNILNLNHSIPSNNKTLQYYYVPWTHTSKIVKELPTLTNIILNSLKKGEKILIHCQCGVSRSASLIVALFMKLRHLSLNDSYNMLKSQAPDISPNMSLIFQLMEWGEQLGVDTIITTPQYESDVNQLNGILHEE